MTLWAAGADRVTFRLRDRLDHPEFSWPRTLLRWPVRWETPSVRPDELRLSRSGVPVPFQLSAVEYAGELVAAADVEFFGALEPGQALAYTLTADASAPVARAAAPVTAVEDGATIVVDTGTLRVRLPRALTGGVAPGPVMQLDRGRGWVGRSRVTGAVERIDTRVVESGPLAATYEVGYRFAGGGRWRVTVRCVAGYDFVDVAEEMTGLAAAWELDWTGFAPTHRFSSTWPYSQDADDHADPCSPETYRWVGIDEPVVVPDSGEDPAFAGPGRIERPDVDFAFRVAPYAPAYAWDIRPHATFWDVAGDSVGVFVRDAAAWDDREYATWASSDTLALHFRYDGVLRWRWPLATGTRRTGIACYDHDLDRRVLARQPVHAAALADRYGLDAETARRATTYQTTYTRQLHHWHGVLDLNRVKDWHLAYAGRRPAPLCREGAITDPDAFLTELFTGEGPRLIAHGVNEIGGYSNIGQRPLYDRLLDAYDRLGARLTAGQRARVDALLLLTAYVSAGEEIAPMRRMLAGHPNFLADGKAALGCLAWLYPEHPAARDWRDQFAAFVRLSGTFHTRPELPGSHGGRWTESLATYVWAYLRPAALGAALGRRADGVERLATPELAAVGAWLVDALTAPLRTSADGGRLRMHPPQGAHAYWPRRIPIEMRLLAEHLRRYRPLVAEHLLWAADDGGHKLDLPPGEPDAWRVLRGPATDRGTNPRLRSAAYTGYGVVLRAGLDTPAEVSVHLQQTDRGPNYRWGIADDNGSGHLYYYADGHSYSGHGPEDAGDRRVPDATFVTSCGIWHDGRIRSIGPNALDRPLVDLTAAQYARITPAADNPVHGRYLGRSVLLVGTDYLVTYDAVAGAQRLVWTWVTQTAPTGHDANRVDHPTDRMPFVRAVSGVGGDGAVSTPVSRGLRLEGTGNALVVVSHRTDLTVDGTPWGALVTHPRGVDHVFRYEPSVPHRPPTVTYDADGVRFAGTAGVVRRHHDGERQLVLVAGTEIGTDEVSLHTDDTRLGISLTYRDPLRCTGTYDAVADTAVTLRGPTRGTWYVDGTPADARRDGDALTVRLPAGRHHWELTTGLPRPGAAPILRTENIAGGALVHVGTVPAADRYHVQLSTDGGTTWRTVGDTGGAPYRLGGLADGTTVHLRAVAANAEHTGPPGADHPLHVTSRPPEPPDGLSLTLDTGRVTLDWGEVLGAGRYRVLRRRPGGPYTEIFAGYAHRHVDPDATGVEPPRDDPDRTTAPPTTIYQYAVAAENGNGVGAPCPPVDTDPRGWLHWQPPVPPAYRERHTYHSPPYTPQEADDA
ncbi:hypothetical protein [Actinocatenispora rupis]|uniref:Fibronectin type-III domain-containing protein n=1 Tax=Actinocatenispora rupis TaxID=519421 RepID=A0A8J3NBK2_9ACTN|nr:hypothetical protein [Actinocatenispora rupis]GID10880.1 hypothetical protein Aru02nite_17690 [Actinocatenispora rupis]